MKIQEPGKKKALLLVNMPDSERQSSSVDLYCDAYGGNSPCDMRLFYDNLTNFLQMAQKKEVPIFTAGYCKFENLPKEIVPLVDEEKYVQQAFFDRSTAFCPIDKRHRKLHESLQRGGISELLIGGFERDWNIYFTATHAIDLGYMVATCENLLLSANMANTKGFFERRNFWEKGAVVIPTLDDVLKYAVAGRDLR